MTEPANEQPVRGVRTLLPHPRFRIPVLGDLFGLNLAKPTQSLVPLVQTLGPVFEKRFFNFSLKVVASPSVIAEVNDEHVWEKYVAPALAGLRPITGDGLFTARSWEPNWQKAHNVLMPAFAKDAMTDYHPSIRGAVEDLVTVWAGAAESGEWVDVPDNLNKLTLEIIARAGFSSSFGPLSERGGSPFVAAMLREMQYAQRWTNLIPFYESVFRRKREKLHQSDVAFVQKTIDDIVRARRDSPNGRRADILERMLGNADPDSGEKLDDANIRNQIITFLIAGSETSANAISFALHYLAANPQIARAAQAEVDARWPERGFPAIGYEDVAKLRYLRRVADETLRLWPVAPGYFRRPKEDTTLSGGTYVFTKSDWVFVSLMAAHRDPQSWGADAEQFDPDRFLAENLRRYPDRVYKPFGTGVRACIGRQFALHEIVLTLAAVVHQFELEPDPSYTLEATEHLTLKPAGLRLRLRLRERDRDGPESECVR